MAEKKVTRARAAKISFQNEFYSDLSASGMLYARIIRSPIKKGIITSVTHPDLPADYYIFTARNIPGKNLMDTPLGKVPILSEGNVSYLGEPIGILAGPDEKKLNQYFSELQIGFDRNSIDYYFSVNDSSRKKEDNEEIQELFSPLITSREILWGNEKKSIDELFKKADPATVVESQCSYALAQLHCSETSGSLCTYEDSILTVFTPTQWFSSLRTILSESLAIKAENIIVKKTKSFSNGTNGIYFNSVITAQTALVSVLTGKSTKLVYTRNEQETFMDSMQPIQFRHRSILEPDGTIKVLDINIKMDAGFINPFCQEIIDRLVIASCGCYRPKNLRVNACAERSYNPPSSIDLRQIDSAAFCAIENHMDTIARTIGIFPTDLRVKNFMTAKSRSSSRKTKEAPFPFSFDIERPLETMDILVKQSDFNRKFFFYNEECKSRKNLLEDNKKITTSAPLKGIGISCAYEGSCYYGSQIYGHDQSLEVTMENEQSVEIHCPSVSDSIELIWKKIVSSVLDVNMGSVKINNSFLTEDEPLSPESVYNNISVMTELLNKCCVYLKKKKDEKKFPATVRRSISAKEKNEWDKENFSGKPFHSTSFAVCSVETEMDRSIYREKIKSINIVISGGKILNLSSAENSVKLAILKVLRSFIKDDEINAEKIHIAFLQSEQPPKQIGELVFQVLPSAIMQAINQTINCRITQIPMCTDSIYNMLKQMKEQSERQNQEEADENPDNTERQKDND